MICVFFFNLYNQDDHGQVRSCKPVEVPSTQKVCHQVPHQACHQVSFVATLLVFRCHQFVIVPIPITLPICLCHSSPSFPPNSPTLPNRNHTRAATRCPPPCLSRWLVRWNLFSQTFVSDILCRCDVAHFLFRFVFKATECRRLRWSPQHSFVLYIAVGSLKII